MNHRRIALMVLAGITAAALPAAAAESVVFVKDGQAVLPIVAPSHQEPAENLQACVEKMTGAKLDIKQDAQDAAIYVGTAKEFPDVAALDKLTTPEGFVLRSRNGSVYVVGKGAQGAAHGVNALLQEMGCRWFFPGETWEVIPQTKTLAVAVDKVEQPTFSTLRRIWHGFGAYSRVRQEYNDWCDCSLMGGTVASNIGHTWFDLNREKDFAEHPEWFALVDGKRKASKPCYSHPEVIAKGIEYAMAAAERSNGQGMVSLTPPDGLGYCECERCFSVFQGGEPKMLHRAWFAERPDGVMVNVTTETLFTFANEIAEAVTKKYPDMQFGVYAYSAYSHPPSFKLHPNIFVQTTTAYRRTPLSMDEQFRRWRAAASRFCVRDYFSVYQWDWDMPDPGKMSPHNIEKHLEHLHELGMNGVNAEASNNFGPRGVGYYMATKLLWDIDTDVDAVLEDFYAKAFGPAAPAMKRYYERQFSMAEAEKDPVDELGQKEVKKLGVAEFLKLSYPDLDEAVAAVKNQPEYRERVDDIRRYLHFVYLKTKVAPAAKEDTDALVAAVKDVTVMGGRLTYTHMVHARPLIGKAWGRTFKKYKDVLPPDEVNKEWRVIGEPPSHEELDRLWAQDKKEMGL